MKNKGLKGVGFRAALLLNAAVAMGAAAAQEPVYLDPKAPVEKRLADLLGRMTLEEKIAYTSGVREQYIREIPRLKIPAINMQDGPVGVHGGGTSFPPAVALAASFDPSLMRAVGEALGRDCRAIGVHVTLGPGMNIVRAPILGRAAEYYGEDPYLTGHLVPELIKGVQSQGAMACAKHYIGNELDLPRTYSDSRIDERTLREIYLPPFDAAVHEGQVATIMGAYNHINGQPSCVSGHMLQEILRDQWGFQGFVMSDWGAGGGPADRWANGALDIAMPGGPMGIPEKVLPLIAAGKIDPAVYDRKVANILRKVIEFGFLDRPQKSPEYKTRDPESRAAALRASREGTVLLKNLQKALPLPTDGSIRTIALIGPNADLAGDGTPYPTGISGSSANDCPNIITIAQAMRKLVGDQVQIQVIPDWMRTLYTTQAYEHPDADGRMVPGLKAQYFKNASFSGTPDLERVDKDLNFSHGWRIKGWLKELRPFGALSVRWTGKITPSLSGKYCLAKESNPGLKVWLNGEVIIDDHTDFDTTHWVRPTTGVFKELKAGESYDLKVEYINRPEVAHLVGLRFGWGAAEPTAELEAARRCDAVVACVGYGYMTEGEGLDRTWELPFSQAQMLKSVASVNPRTIVVLNGGGACQSEEWIDKVPALIHGWYFADAGGQAVAEILLGKTNPSGKLPASFAKRWEDNPSAAYFHADWSKKGNKPVNYTEGIFVGYRGFDKSGTEPLFAFGHGLSYTSFAYENFKIDSSHATDDSPVVVTCQVRNTGRVAGAEVAQLYIGQPGASVPRPVRELKGFKRLELQPGEVQSVTFALHRRDFCFYDVAAKAWRAEPGMFQMAVGASSRDLRWTGSFELPR